MRIKIQARLHEAGLAYSQGDLTEAYTNLKALAFLSETPDPECFKSFQIEGCRYPAEGHVNLKVLSNGDTRVHLHINHSKDKWKDRLKECVIAIERAGFRNKTAY